MAIDVESLSPKQLAELIARASQRQEDIQRQRLSEVREKLVSLARKEGFTIEELFGTPRRVKRTVKPKYRNPNAPFETWSGRGKQPHWFRAALLAGCQEKEMLIG